MSAFARRRPRACPLCSRCTLTTTTAAQTLARAHRASRSSVRAARPRAPPAGASSCSSAPASRAASPSIMTCSTARSRARAACSRTAPPATPTPAAIGCRRCAPRAQAPVGCQRALKQAQTTSCGSYISAHRGWRYGRCSTLYQGNQGHAPPHAARVMSVSPTTLCCSWPHSASPVRSHQAHVEPKKSTACSGARRDPVPIY